ncbi:MAG: ATP-binding protein [Terracidiphilus sp.]|jgi:signal transduction histidine kinase
MQQSGQTAGWDGAERRRVEAVVETLATLGGQGESLAEVAHDARNMVTALGLYCDLLEEPGVLGAPFLHYGNELRLVAAASRRLVEKLVALDTRMAPEAGSFPEGLLEPGGLPGQEAAGGRLERRRLGGNKQEQINPMLSNMERSRRWDLMPAQPIDNLARELHANRNLLAALAGSSIAVSVDAEGGARAVRLTGEDLTRVLVNLVKNAAEAMPAGGRIQLVLRESAGSPPAQPGAQPGAFSGAGATVLLTVEDNGPGIPRKALEKIFDSGYTTRTKDDLKAGGWPGIHRGLGLSITRSIIEEAGGRIYAANRSQPGARLEIELPVRNR